MKPTIWYLVTIEKVDGSCDNNGIYMYRFIENLNFFSYKWHHRDMIINKINYEHFHCLLINSLVSSHCTNC
jgi:hypothetical protein